MIFEINRPIILNNKNTYLGDMAGSTEEAWSTTTAAVVRLDSQSGLEIIGADEERLRPGCGSGGGGSTSMDELLEQTPEMMKKLALFLKKKTKKLKLHAPFTDSFKVSLKNDIWIHNFLQMFNFF